MFFPLAMGVLIGASLIFFLFLAVLAFTPDISLMISPVMVAFLKDVGGPVAAGFGGAIAGAVCSYIFQRKNEKEREMKADISVIHKTAIHLLMQTNELYSIKKHNIYPSLKEKARFLDISKIPVRSNVVDRIDTRVIDVALSVKDASLIDNIFLAEARYRACFENFSNRNLSLDEFRSTVKSSGLARKDSYDLLDLYKVVGAGQLVALHVMTEQMIEVLDEALTTLTNSMVLLTALVDKKYKGTGVPSLKMDMKKNEEYLKKSSPPYFDVESLKKLLRSFDEE